MTDTMKKVKEMSPKYGIVKARISNFNLKCLQTKPWEVLPNRTEQPQKYRRRNEQAEPVQMCHLLFETEHPDKGLS